jgi:hypothetical protein
MNRRGATLVMFVTLVSGAPVHAREPIESDWLPLPPPVASTSDPAPFVVPAGLYYVTDTYVGDVVATNGSTTTYSTTTVHESTGTYARVIDTVDTGARSTFDGQAFNGRGALTDGRALGGTYYENFVLTTSGFVPVSIVFFQDDSETRRRGAASSPAPASSPASSRAPATTVPTSTSVPAIVSPGSRAARTPTPSFKRQPPIAPAPPTLRAGIALAPDGPTLASAEVLRGRTLQLWPRAFANDVPMPIRSWRLLSAQPDRISATSGSVDPLVAQWIRMPAPGVRWSLRFELFTELAPAERLEAEISITVRSPALID